MLNFLAKRLLSTLPVLLIVSVLVFLMLRLTPGDPAAVLAGDAASTEQIAQIRANLGLDKSVPEQFFIWAGHLLQGDLGQSYYYKTEVTTLIAQRLEPTLSLALVTITVAVLVAVPLGVLAAWRFGGWLDKGLMGFSVLGFSVPVFVSAYLLIWLVSLKLGWLPVQGYRRIADGVGPWVYHLTLPAITLSLIYIALIARVTRASVLETLGEDYIRTARAKGLPEATVLMRHALANAAVPIATVIGIGIALLIGGVVVTESVYAIPGLGRLTVDAVLARDFPTIQGADPVVLVRLRDGQPAGRPVLCVFRPPDPVLSMSAVTPDFEALSVESATVHVQPSAWARVRRNLSVRIGGSVMLLLVLISLAAPWMGTVDPSLFDPASRDLVPGQAGEITTLDGELLQHRFLMGSDSFGRDIYSRVIYGTQVSLIVGLFTALVALSFGITLGLLAGFLRWLDGPLMRVMDGVMAIPAILIAIALVAMWRGSLTTVVIAIAIPEIPRVVRLVRSLVLDHPRRALCGGGHLAGHADLEDHAAPHPAQHRGAAGGAGHLHLRGRHPHRGGTVLPGCGPAARHPHLGQCDGRRPGAVQPVPAQHLLPRHLPGGDGAGRQHAGRRPA